MMLLAIVLISHAAAYKVHSNEAKVVKEDPIPHRYEDTSGLCTQHLDCKRLVAEWGCDITWAETCPHTTHPLGAEFAIEALNKYCPLQCRQLADGHDKTDPDAKIKRKFALMEHTASCLNQKAKEAKDRQRREGISQCVGDPQNNDRLSWDLPNTQIQGFTRLSQTPSSSFSLIFIFSSRLPSSLISLHIHHRLIPGRQESRPRR